MMRVGSAIDEKRFLISTDEKRLLAFSRRVASLMTASVTDAPIARPAISRIVVSGVEWLP